jgi:hypothetical protein
MTDVVVSSRHGQRMAALAEANRVRESRAAVKRDLKAGRVSLVDALEHPDCGSALVIDLLLALPRVGRTIANRAMARARVSTVKTVGGMTERQRAALLVELTRWPSVRDAAANTLGPGRMERPGSDVRTSRLGPEQSTTASSKNRRDG